jgi:hypothetical protein
MRKTGDECSRRSSQYPINIGTTASSEIDVTRADHWHANANGERSSRCSVTAGDWLTEPVETSLVVKRLIYGGSVPMSTICSEVALFSQFGRLAIESRHRCHTSGGCNAVLLVFL